jgi:hypothetical protein
MSLSVRCCLSAVLLMTAPLAKPVWSQPRIPLERSHDYRFPSPSDPRDRVTVLKVSRAQVYASGEPVSYVGFDGRTYKLNRFHGRYVDILLPDAWLGPEALSEEQVHHFVDRTDLIYQYYLDLLGTPPAGDGPVPIAVLPEVCGGGALGCGLIGKKGVEMADVADYRSQYWQEIASDVPSGVLIHELTHNFDVFASYLEYEADGIHGWTTFITNYYPAFTREGTLTDTPEAIVQYALSYALSYFRDPTATWESCVRDDRCEDREIRPEFTYGAVGLQLALRHGPQTIRGFAAFLSEYVRSHQPPATAEAKNDLYVEALAAGTHLNLSCTADAWRWPVSDALRQRMEQLYGTRNPDCEDQDHDGFTPLQGDCNDHRSDIHPGAPERRNHLDDDCDGIVDNLRYDGTAGTSLTAPRAITVPSEASGETGGLSQDFYRIHLSSPAQVQIGLCQENAIYAQVAIVRAGTLFDRLQLPGSGCAQQSFSLDAGDWELVVGIGSEDLNAYTMTLQEPAPWPLPPWAKTAPPTERGRQLVLRAPTALPRLPATPTSVRFWVSGQGYVGTVPYSRTAAFLWTPPAGVDPQAAGVTYRAQILADGTPVYEVTPQQGFE